MSPRSLMVISIFVTLAFQVPRLHAADTPEPYVDRHGWLGVNLEQKPLEGGGIRVTQVVSGGPAQRGGLRSRDVILAVKDTKVDSLETLVRLISSTEPGTPVVFLINRQNRPMSLTITVGHRREGLGPMVEGGRTLFRSNDDIHPEWKDKRDDFSQWMTSLLEKQGKADLYSKLVAAFERDADLFQVFYKLDEVAYVRRDPLRLPQSSRALTDRFSRALADEDGIDGLLQAASKALDTPLPEGPDAPAATPKAVLESMAFALGLRNRAFSKLSGGELAFLHNQSLNLFEKFKEHIYIQVQSSDAMLQNNLAALRLTKKVDYGMLFLAGLCLARTAKSAAAVPADAWTAAALNGVPCKGIASGDVIACVNTNLGAVVIGGPGQTVYFGDAALIIDMGGDDIYLNNAGASTRAFPIALVVDHQGDDTYSGHSVCQGVGHLGAGYLLDLAGDDRYEAVDHAQGCGLLGVGILRDSTGDDRYTAHAYHAGAGLFGMGLLIDDAGDDRYSARLYSQGFGATKGLGLLMDRSGADSYYASGHYPSSYGTPGVYRGMSQGFGIGFRSIAAGGIGVLLDESGNDHYVAGNFSQGGGYFLSLGILRDRTGNDRFQASRYNQGFGVHSAAGILLDDRGNDRYRCEVAANQGSAWDLGVGYLIDGAGNDKYEAHGLAQGGSSQNGFAALIDLGGDDDYHARGSGQGFGGQTTYAGGRGARNLGILVDAGSGKDKYNKDDNQNGVLRLDDKGGLFADLPGTLMDDIERKHETPGKIEPEDKNDEEDDF